MPKARAGSLNRQRGKAVDNGGLRYGAMESALRPPLPTATPPIGDLPYRSFAEARFLHRLTNPAGQNIITPISGSTRKVAGIKSEPRPASNRNQWPASCRMPGRLRRNPHVRVEEGDLVASTPTLDCLREDAPLSLRAMAIAWCGAGFWEPWGRFARP